VILISLAEYAELLGVKPDTVRQKVLRGGLKTARKIGRNWVIDRDEPYIDNRIKSGKYKKGPEA
jgi:excisionase family DNA binding protein